MIAADVPSGAQAIETFHVKRAHCGMMMMRGRYGHECHGQMMQDAGPDPCAEGRCLRCVSSPQLNCSTGDAQSHSAVGVHPLRTEVGIAPRCMVILQLWLTLMM